jgi:hypothetical protein
LRKFTFVLLISSLLLAACGPSPEDIAATAQSLAETAIALTQAAIPTDTPSSTPTETPEPTATATLTSSFTDTPAPSATPTAKVQAAKPTATFIPGKTAPLLLDNRTDEIIWIVIDAPIYYELRFDDPQLVTVPWGDFHYQLWIGEKGPYSGNFRINNKDKHTLVIENGSVKFHTP